MPKPRPSKPPRIGKGHKKPSFKPNSDEVERRITAVELLLSRGARKTEIHDAMEKQFGIHWRTADEYTVRARDRLLKRLGKPKEEHRCESLSFYESMMRSAECKSGDKIRACERKDKLLGLDAPQKTEISGPAGGPVQTQDLTAELAGLNKHDLRGIIAACGNGETKPSLSLSDRTKTRSS